MKRIIDYVRPYFLGMSLGLVIKFLGTIMDLALPWILAYMIDTVVPMGDTRLIYIWGGMMLLCAVVAVLANIIANRMASKVARDATRAIRHDLFARIMRLSLKQIDFFTTPSLILRLTGDTYNMHRVLGMIQRLGVRAPILLLGGVAVTMALDFRLSLVLLATLPLIAVAIVLISRKGMPMYTKVQQATDRVVRIVRDDVTGARVIKALSKEQYEIDKFAEINQDVVNKETKAALVMGMTNPLMNLLLNGGLTAVIIVGAVLVNGGASEPGKIIAFMTYFTIILNAMLSINRMFVMVTQAAASAGRITEVIDAPMELTAQEGKAEEEEAHIVFDDVSFAYNEDKAALNDITFKVNHGETLGIIGATGSGKTTVIQLLQRFYDVTSGEIRIDGRNVKTIPEKELHDMFGVAFQQDAFFADTIYENVDFGRKLPEDQIVLALKCAQAWDFVQEKPDQMQHMLTVKGSNLSGGQKQRLLIARALAGNPQILILDDSSSALDYETDAMLRLAIRRHFSDTTTLLIAQRVSSIRYADHILVLEDGHMAGFGNDEELMRDCEIYKETADVQMGGM